MKKTKTLIIFEDGRSDLERTAKGIVEGLDPGRYECKLRSASAVTIPEVLAAELFFFGAEEPKSSSYAELVRLLEGVNLAGRRVAYFGGSGAAVAWLKEMSSAAELGVAVPDLVGARLEGNALATWLRSIA